VVADVAVVAVVVVAVVVVAVAADVDEVLSARDIGATSASVGVPGAGAMLNLRALRPLALSSKKSSKPARALGV
jgi:hypothetical protein